MKYTLAAAALAATAYASPSPSMSNLKKIRQAAPAITDGDILNYALTLEHLEDTFYRYGTGNFTASDFTSAGFAAPFYDNLKTIAGDEKTHVAFLTAALSKAGATPVGEAVYDFGIDFSDKSAKNINLFVATASILEGVGVSAYLGAAAEIANAAYLTAAGSILTVESRHSSYIRAALKQIPFPSPFDVPLSFNEVYTLAAPFIKSPGSGPTLPFKPFPALTVSNTTADPVKTGSTVNILLPKNTALVAADGKSPIYAAFITVTGPVFTLATPIQGGFSAVIPKAPEGTAPIAGQSYVILTGCNTTVSDETVKAGPGIVEVTPS